MEQYRRNWKNYYEVLQVSPNAEAVVITAAYRRLAQEYHPDSTRDKADSKKMAELNEAYEVLSDAGRRTSYDLELKMRQRQATYDNILWTRNPPGSHTPREYTAETPSARPTAAKNRAGARPDNRKEAWHQAKNGLLMLVVGGILASLSSTIFGEVGLIISVIITIFTITGAVHIIKGLYTSFRE